jgi:hypothetical protein
MTPVTALAARAPAPRDGRPLPPADRAVAQLPSLLDRDAMATVLERSLRGRSAIDDVRISSVDYRPGSGASVTYDACVDGRRHLALVTAGPAAGAEAARTPARLAIARALGGDSPAARPLMYDVGLGALVQWYPLDHRIPVLAKPVAELRRVLSLAGIAVESTVERPETLLYRPGERAVLRLGDHVLKAYADDDAFAAGLRGLRLAERLGAGPRLEAALPELRLTVQPAIDGEPLSRLRATEIAPAAGAILRTLHDLDVPGLERVTPQRLLNTVGAAGTLVAAVAPELAAQVRRLVRRLAATTPHGLAAAPAHGDYNLSQFLDVDGTLAVLDFDEACLAPPALDIAEYAANLVSGRAGDLEAAEPALEALLDGYGDRPDGVRWYLAASIARRAPTPFRRHKRHWPERMASILDAAEAVLPA